MAEALTREEILAAEDRITEEVAVPEWSESKIVLVASLVGEDRDRLEQEIVRDRDDSIIENIRAKLCARTIVDKEGKRLFGEDDIALLGKKSGTALDRVFEVAQRINRLTAADIKELEKNSGETQPEDSTSN